jgi:hypothetical protein
VHIASVIHNGGPEAAVERDSSTESRCKLARERLGVADDCEIEVEAMRPSEQEVADCSSDEVRRSGECVEHRREPVERAQLVRQIHLSAPSSDTRALKNSDRVDLDERA